MSKKKNNNQVCYCPGSIHEGWGINQGWVVIIKETSNNFQLTAMIWTDAWQWNIKTNRNKKKSMENFLLKKQLLRPDLS